MEVSEGILDAEPPKCDARIHYGPHASQFGDLRLPEGQGPFPIVIGIHGGWWRARHGLETHSHLCEAFKEHRIASWNIEYRRIGEEGGGWPNTLIDTGSAIDILKELSLRYPIDLSRVLTVGFSAGGQLALWAAARKSISPGSALYRADPLPIKSAFSLAGAVDLVRCAEENLSDGIVKTFMGGLPKDLPWRYNETCPRRLTMADTSVFLIHGTSDTSVPHTVSQSYHSSAIERGQACKLKLLPNTGHFDLINPRSTAWRTIISTISFDLERR